MKCNSKSSRLGSVYCNKFYTQIIQKILAHKILKKLVFRSYFDFEKQDYQSYHKICIL